MSKKSNNPVAKIFAFLGGFHVAIVCMVLLLILTWLSTLEQVGPGGLYWTLHKYFSFDALIVHPTLYGKDLPILLPGGYWVCAVFTLNLLIGGVMRIRKGWKHAAVLVSHFSMLMLMVGGAVTYHQSREAYMSLEHGSTGDGAFSLNELAIEIAEIKDGDKQGPTVIASELLSPVRGKLDNSREFLLPNLPFDVTVSDYNIHAKLYPVQGNVDPSVKVIDGYYAATAKPTGAEETNLSSCIVTVKNRESGESQDILLFEGVSHDITTTVDGKVYGFRLQGEVWALPFQIRLDDSRGEKHPGTGLAMTYESDVTVLDSEGNDERKFKIEMNQPLRYKGLTFYQTSWDNSGEKTISGFTVKTNPSDQWPKYAIYTCGAALFVHFIIKLFGFVSASIARSKNEQ